MSGIFLDTGYLIALVNKKDDLHEVAQSVSNKFHGPFLTTHLVLVELANSLSLPDQRQIAIDIIEKILADPLTTVAPFTSDKFKKAFSFYKKRADKPWGMVDCFSFITMDEFGVKQALTFDEHFKQAGYAVPIL